MWVPALLQARAKSQKEVEAAMADYAAQKALLQRKTKEVDLLYEKVRAGLSVHMSICTPYHAHGE